MIVRLELPDSMACALAWAYMVGDPRRPTNVLPYRYGADGGKWPAVKEWTQRHGGGALAGQSIQLWRDWGRYARRSNIRAWAVLPGALGVVVVDVDAPHLLGRVLDLYGETPVYVETPSGGYHLYYQAGASPPQTRTGVRGPGTYDVKSIGGTTHAPGTSRPDGRTYVAVAPELDDAGTLIVGTRPALAAGALYATLPTFRADVLDAEWAAHHPATDDLPMDGDPRYVDTPGEVDALRAYMRAAGPAVSGQGGHPHTFKLLRKIGDLGASESLALELALEWDRDNEPPWGPIEIGKKVRDAYRRRQSPVGWRIAELRDAADESTEQEVDADALAAMLRDLKFDELET